MGGVRRDEAQERDDWVALAHAAEPEDAGLAALVEAVGAREAVDRVVRGLTGLPHGPAMATRLVAGAPQGADDRAHAVGARIVTRADREWPGQLGDLGRREPYALWIRGAADLRLMALRSLAIVGARACTPYGEEVARDWSACLSSEWTIVSGGAFGIDAAAHRGALSANGTTVCVLAGGVDVAYPRAHELLLARIADEGLLVSESPPGESVRRQRFLARNRVIAALTRATVVVEAAERSGTIATARAAAAMRRPVAAVPGPVTSPSSAGCHRMIREGEALLVADVDDLRSLVDLGHQAPAAPADPRSQLTVAERAVLDALPARGERTPDELAAAACIALSDVWAALGALEAAEWITPGVTGWRLRRPARLPSTSPVP